MGTTCAREVSGAVQGAGHGDWKWARPDKKKKKSRLGTGGMRVSSEKRVERKGESTKLKERRIQETFRIFRI